MEARDLKTRFAMQASDLADTFNAAFGDQHIDPADFAPELTSPDGLSTAGGALALQHIRLVPRRASALALLVGSVNPAERSVELRSFDYVDAVHRERLKRVVDLDRKQYEKLLTEFRTFFDVMRFSVTVLQPSPRAAPPLSIPSRSPKASAWLGFVLGAILAGTLAAGGTWFLLRGASSSASFPAPPASVEKP